MTHQEFLEKQWATYKKICDQKGMDTGTKEAFIERNTPKDYKPDQLLEVTPKPACLKVKTPLMKAEENVTISRRVLRRMLEDATKRGYELGKEDSA